MLLPMDLCSVATFLGADIVEARGEDACDKMLCGGGSGWCVVVCMSVTT